MRGSTTRGEASRRVGRDEEDFARRLGLGGDQQVAPGARAGDGEEEALVVLLEDEHVVAGVGAELVPPHLVRPDGVVGPHVEDRAVVVRPGEAVVDVLDRVGEVVTGAQVAEAQRVALTAGEVGRVREQIVGRA